MRALECIQKHEDVQAVTTAIRSVYASWAQESARYLQKVAGHGGLLGKIVVAATKQEILSGECILFVDGLRFDVAQRLLTSLERTGYKIEDRIRWAALPSVTATGKAAVCPVRNLIRGEAADADFVPSVAKTGKSLKDGNNLKKLLTDN